MFNVKPEPEPVAVIKIQDKFPEGSELNTEVPVAGVIGGKV